MYRCALETLLYFLQDFLFNFNFWQNTLSVRDVFQTVGHSNSFPSPFVHITDWLSLRLRLRLGSSDWPPDFVTRAVMDVRKISSFLSHLFSPLLNRAKRRVNVRRGATLCPLRALQGRSAGPTWDIYLPVATPSRRWRRRVVLEMR